MKNILFFFCFFLLLSPVILIAQPSGYEITITLKPFKNQMVYLGYHYGKIKALSDSAFLNAESKAIIKGNQPLPGGIYFIVSQQKQILFEILIDKQQVFSIEADSAKGYNHVVFQHSPDNEMFQQYTAFVGEKGSNITSQINRLSSATNASDSIAIQKNIKTLNEEIQTYRRNVEKDHPKSMLTALFKAMEEPVIPPASSHPKGKYDSVYAYQYFKNHYWDGVSFEDQRLLRTPIFEAKLDKYFKELVVPVPDSIIKEMDKMLLKAKPNKEMYKFLVNRFAEQYINPQYMGQDAVFVHLFEKHINNNPSVDWYTEKQQKQISDRAYSLMANLIGQPAQNLIMMDTSGKSKSLYEINAPFTVICFWDPTCGHCKEMVPKLDSLYRLKWQKAGIKILGVMVDGGVDNWKKYIKENQLNWIHVYQTNAQREADYAAGRASYKQLYDVYQTPVLYLLDKEKRIIAKKLEYYQIDEVITLKSK